MTVSVHPISKNIIIKHCKSSNYFLQICDDIGIKIYRGYLSPKAQKIEIKGLKSGNYTLNISDEKTFIIKPIKI